MSDEKPFVVVSVLDPAIDTDATPVADMLKYAETRDIKLLKWRHGVQPTRYYLREILHSRWEGDVRTADSAVEQYKRAFMCSVVRVENLVQRGGGIIPDYTPAGLPQASCMQDAECDRFQPRIREEIGSVAFTRSFFGWGIAPTFRVPHLCLLHLEERAYRPAAATPQPPAQSSSEASQASATLPAASSLTRLEPSSNGASSDSPTAATATAPSTVVV